MSTNEGERNRTLGSFQHCHIFTRVSVLLIEEVAHNYVDYQRCSAFLVFCCCKCYQSLFGRSLLYNILVYTVKTRNQRDSYRVLQHFT